MANLSKVIALNEVKRVCYKKNLGMMIGFPVFFLIFSLYALNAVLGELPFPKTVIVESFLKFFLFIYSISLGLFIAYAFSMDVYIADKKDKALETLCSSPLSIRDIWMGKTLAMISLGYPAALVTSILFWIVANFMVFGTIAIFPEPIMWLHLFALVPVALFSMVGLGGIGQLISKRYAGASLIFFFIAFSMVWVPSMFPKEIAMISPTTLFLYFAAATIVLISALYIGVKLLLNKEKIVLSA